MKVLGTAILTRYPRTFTSITFAAAVIFQSCGVAVAQPIYGPEQQIIDTLDNSLGQPASKDVELRLGAGPVATFALDNGGRRKVYGLPLVFFRYKDYLSIDETQARLNVVPVDSSIGIAGFRAGPMVKVDFGRRAFASGVTGPGKVGTSIEVGGFVSYTVGVVRLRARVRHDVASGHNGSLAEFDFRTGLYRRGPFGLGLQVSTAWASKDYMQSFFGVTPAQAIGSHLPVYSPRPGFKDVRGSLTAEYKFSEHWSSATSVQYVRRIGDALHSPVVTLKGAADRINTGVFALYAF